MQLGAQDPVDSSRRGFLLGSIAVLLGASAGVRAESHARLPRIGFLSLQSSPQRLESFAAGMREFGYVDGKTVAIAWRLTQGKVGLLPDYAAELVKLKPNLIIAVEPQSVDAVRRLTDSIPIVFVVGQDPIGLGFARSLARPGGNITGSTSMFHRRMREADRADPLRAAGFEAGGGIAQPDKQGWLATAA